MYSHNKNILSNNFSWILIFLLMLNNSFVYKEYNYHLPINLLLISSIFIGGSVFSFKFSLSQLILFLLLLLLPFISILNDGSAYHAFGKSIKIILFFLILSVPVSCLNNLEKWKKIFAMVHITLFCVFIIIGVEIDNGVNNSLRFSGGYGDSNYLAAIFYTIFFTGGFFYLFLALSTQSLSGIFSFFLSKYLSSYYSKVAYFMCFLPSFLYFFERNLIDDYFLIEPNDWIDLRLNSLLLRIISFYSGAEFLQNYGWFGFFFGIGSGRSYEFSERVLHSFYTQSFVDHGVFYAFIWVKLFFILCKKFNIPSRLILFICFMNITLDLFSTLVAPIMIVMFRFWTNRYSEFPNRR